MWRIAEGIGQNCHSCEHGCFNCAKVNSRNSTFSPILATVLENFSYWRENINKWDLTQLIMWKGNTTFMGKNRRIGGLNVQGRRWIIMSCPSGNYFTLWPCAPAWREHYYFDDVSWEWQLIWICNWLCLVSDDYLDCMIKCLTREIIEMHHT